MIDRLNFRSSSVSDTTTALVAAISAFRLFPQVRWDAELAYAMIRWVDLTELSDDTRSLAKGRCRAVMEVLWRPSSPIPPAVEFAPTHISLRWPERKAELTLRSLTQVNLYEIQLRLPAHDALRILARAERAEIVFAASTGKQELARASVLRQLCSWGKTQVDIRARALSSNEDPQQLAVLANQLEEARRDLALFEARLSVLEG